MRYPNHLPEGGTIGFLAPSFGCATEPYFSGFQNAQKKFQTMGYRLTLGFNCYESKGVGISNTPEECAREVMQMFTESEADCLISCGGGELMCEILPFVDFEKLKKAAPKWFMGYSDNTNLTYLLATLTDTAAIYGPCAGAFGMEPWHPSLEDAMGLLTGKQTEVHEYPFWEKESLKDEGNPLCPYHTTEPLAIKSYLGKTKTEKEQQFSGRLLGGCLDCLATLSGTRFDKTREFAETYKEDGIIWFLEACDLNTFSMRRAMWQLEQTGWFQHVKGFLIGRPRLGEPVMGLDAENAVLEIIGKYQVPVIMDVDLGHLPPMMPLIVGSVAEVKVKGNHISIAQQLR